MLTTWWKKKVSPIYEVEADFYPTVGRFLQKHQQCEKFTLTIVDNSFGNIKANLLCDALHETNVKNFTLLNRALVCNWQNE